MVSCLSTLNAAKQVEHTPIAKMRSVPAFSEEVEEWEAVGDGSGTRPYRNPATKHLPREVIKKQFYGGEHGTMIRAVRDVAMKNPSKRAIAYRPWDHIEHQEIEENGKKRIWEYIHLKETRYWTYSEMWKRMVAFGGGLRRLNLPRGARIALYEETRPEWITSLYGMWMQHMEAVTMYSNLGEDAMEYALRESAPDAIICNEKSLPLLSRLFQAAKVHPMVIYLDDLAHPSNSDSNPPSKTKKIDMDLHRWEDVLTSGMGDAEPQDIPDDPDEVALVMYTSGTTGDPKGVVLTHGNLFAGSKSFCVWVVEFIGEVAPDDETYICYLPLAHIYEFTTEGLFLLRGSTLCYGHPRTLTDTSARPRGDFAEYKPHFITGVPRVYDTLKKAVYCKLPPEGSLKRRIFERAFDERKRSLERGLDTPYWNHKVFSATRNLIGGCCKAIISGGAPLSSQTQEFMSIVFGCAVAQGYGLTETCAIGGIQRRFDMTSDSIGGPLACVEFRLRDVDEFKHTDAQPRGELCIRGPFVAKGYFNQPGKTAEAFGPGGWFYTGDVATVDSKGGFHVIGRTKALAKNSCGEYVALEALEALYIQNEIAVANGVCIVASPLRPYCAALVLADETKCMKFAADRGIHAIWPDVLEHPSFVEQATASFAQLARKAGKRPHEVVRRVKFIRDDWTPENGVFTAAMKLKRRAIDERYSAVIHDLFSD